jgi:hypothetical protein
MGIRFISYLTFNAIVFVTFVVNVFCHHHLHWSHHTLPSSIRISSLYRQLHFS